ncbi:Putative cysteine proteinase [Habropoda laboriosa]|uniref:Putative cysteine proteinase n=1 Tax=Habropoda laboriosa TaxID=597456 RepID=A0A0L7R748_9HYME|nr:Putative cysteine proteinase [Habropoda laboriosa]
MRVSFLFLINSILVSSNSVNKAVQNVPEPLVQSALNSLNQDSPTHHTYKGGNLISAQKLEELPYIIYRLTFDLTPTCKEALEPCPREACTVEVKQHEDGDIKVLRESIQCMYLYPQSVQDEPLQVQENNQDQEIVDNLDKQIINNHEVKLDHEIQKSGDHNDRPFIAMRSSNPNYCPGCPYELNPNLPGVIAFGEQIVKSMDELIQNDFKHKVVGIVKVTRTVPPSSNVIQYQILLHVGESDCLKNAVEQSECSVQTNLPIKVCLVTFEEQPWQQSSRKITKNNCTVVDNVETINSYSTLTSESLATAAPNKEQMNPEKLEALENLKDILDNYTYATTTKLEEQEQSEVTEHPMIKVTVNGSDDDAKAKGFEDKTKEFGEFLKDFDLPTREVQSNPEINREEVTEEIIIPKKLEEGSEIKECLFTIWSQPWLDKGSPQITINCDLNNRRKRSLRGAQYNQKMLKLAEEVKDDVLFKDFTTKFNKTYSSAKEKQYRFKIFKQNLININILQTLEQGTAEYGVTMFADLTRKEFQARYLGLRPDLKLENNISLPEAEIPDIPTPLPPKFDWRDYGAVTPVKNQGQCGSCWAFSVTGNVEGQYAIKHGKLLSLSEQELVDCDSLDEGCEGGLMDNAYKAIERLGGLELETDYPYDAKNEKCHFLKNKAMVQVAAAVNITSNETKMAQWLVKNGPISIGINANAMQFYVGGIAHPFKFLCDPETINHGVLIVGYGMKEYRLFNRKLPYWIIKNSWGPRWGEQGYYRIYRGNGACGLNTMASSAIVT